MSDAFGQAVAPFGFDRTLVERARAALAQVAGAWQARDRAALAVGAKVIKCFADAAVNEADLAGTTGYGYHDAGRDRYEALLAQALDAQAAFARLQLVSGTHAIVAAVHAVLGSDGRLCSVTGEPYDTLQLALTRPLASQSSGSRARYVEVALDEHGLPDHYGIAAALATLPEVVFIQRSRGYARRRALSIGDIDAIVKLVRAHSPASIIVVDNCYGEFVELREPCAVGADLVVGSLIKNPGGGLAPAGAYVAGRAALVERVASSVFALGLGRNVGPTLEVTRWLMAGLHRAPHAVAESLKILDFAAALFAALGFVVDPTPGAPRFDIIQAIQLGDPQKLIRFAEGLQKMLPVNSRARPVPGQVPGYEEPVIMAMGSFISGATMELSCDAPVRPPYEVYLQGGVDVTHGVLAVMGAAQALL
jgi:cystathionine beta-lyase family protein involved in aluminum resistance